MIFQKSGPILLKQLYFGDFSGWAGLLAPLPPLDPRIFGVANQVIKSALEKMDHVPHFVLLLPFILSQASVNMHFNSLHAG